MNSREWPFYCMAIENRRTHIIICKKMLLLTYTAKFSMLQYKF